MKELENVMSRLEKETKKKVNCTPCQGHFELV